MAIDYSRMAEPDNWFNGFDESGNLVKYVSDPQNGNRLVTQADYDALRAQQDQGMAEGRQRLADAGGVWAGADLNARPAGVPDNWRIFGAENGQGYFWGPQEWAQPNHDNGFFQNMQDFFNPHKNGGMIPLYTAAGVGLGAAALGGEGVAGGGELAGESGAETLTGTAAGDTGGSMATSTDWTYNSTTGEWDPPSGFNDTGAFDQSGSMSSPTGMNADGTGVDNSTIWGGTSSNPFGTSGLNFSDVNNVLNAYKLMTGGPNGGLFGTGGGGLFGGGFGDTAARVAPGLMALGYAGSQTPIDTGQLNAILGSLGGNQDAIVKAATDPVNKNIAAGYGDLLQSQALRGIRGSSFGNTDIANYIGTTSNALANAGANAAQGSLALQGNLAGNIATLRAQSQQMKNSLYGRAFDVLGRGLNPQGYAGTTNISTGGGAAPAGGSGGAPGMNLNSLIPLITSAINYAA